MPTAVYNRLNVQRYKFWNVLPLCAFFSGHYVRAYTYNSVNVARIVLCHTHFGQFVFVFEALENCLSVRLCRWMGGVTTLTTNPLISLRPPSGAVSTLAATLKLQTLISHFGNLAMLVVFKYTNGAVQRWQFRRTKSWMWLCQVYSQTSLAEAQTDIQGAAKSIRLRFFFAVFSAIAWDFEAQFYKHI